MPRNGTSKVDLDSISYRTNYLTEVIARFDYLTPINELGTKLPRKLTKQVKTHFPIAEPQSVRSTELQLSPTESKVMDSTTVTEWQFHGKQRDKTFTIGVGAVWVKYTSYSTYEVLKDEFSDVLTVLFECYPELQGKRLGLRYINNLALPDGNPLSWDDYLNPGMLGVFGFLPRSESLSRVFHLIEYNYGDYSLRYQYGMHNPDFPAPIRQRVFVLDFDAYYQGLHDRDEVSASLDRFHAGIQSLFELSITDDMRALLNAK